MKAVLTKGKLAGLAVLGAIWLPAVAYAQQPSVDPQADSPAGTIYELPLDNARQDAAPKRPSDRGSQGAAGGHVSGDSGGSGTGSGTGSSGGGGAISAIRSENGFGSSDSVPGADDPGTGGTGDTDSGDRDVAGENQRAQTLNPALDAGAAKTAQAHAPSSAVAYLLLGLVLLVAVAIGLATRRQRGGGGAV